MLQEVVQEIENMAKAVVDQVHTMLLAKVVKFDKEKCVATVQPYGKFTLSNGYKVDFPQITDVPVMMLMRQPEDFGIAFPVKENDEGMLIMSEIELDSWRSQSESNGLLKFDLTSAVFLPGIIRSSETLKEAIDKDALIARWGDNKIVLSKDGTAISGDLKVEGDIIYTGNIKRP